MSLTASQVSYLGQLKSLIGGSRLGPYLAAEKGDLSRSLARYYWNIELCKALYPALHVLEVDLRNSIDRAVSPQFPVRGDPHAYRSVRSWLTRTDEVVVHPGGRDTVNRVLSKVCSKSLNANARKTHDDLVAASSFGLWVGMLETAYDHPGTRGVFLWPQHKNAAFPGATAESMTTIRTTMNGLRHFRNRVFHHEPIWAKSEKAPSPNDRYGEILRALRWLGSQHSQIIPRLHEPVGKLDSAEGIELANSRLMVAVDEALQAAEQKKVEKEARKAARRARGDQ